MAQQPANSWQLTARRSPHWAGEGQLFAVKRSL
jgi:hypothetical protein